MNVLTGDEVLNEAINAMGSLLGDVYHVLGDEVAWLYLKWNGFRELFADSDLVDVLNSAAPASSTIFNVNMGRFSDAFMSCD